MQKAQPKYADVFADPIIKNAFFTGLFLRLIPWAGFFVLQKYSIPLIGPVIHVLNIAHVTLTLLFPVWMAALYYLPNITTVRDSTTRFWLYVIAVYLILTPGLVILGSLLVDQPLAFFKSYKLFG